MAFYNGAWFNWCMNRSREKNFNQFQNEPNKGGKTMTIELSKEEIAIIIDWYRFLADNSCNATKDDQLYGKLNSIIGE